MSPSLRTRLQLAKWREIKPARENGRVLDAEKANIEIDAIDGLSKKDCERIVENLTRRRESSETDALVNVGQ